MAGQVLQLAADLPRVLPGPAGLPRVLPADLPRVLPGPAVEAPIGLAEQVATATVGRLVEISGQGDAAGLTLAVDLVRQVQGEGETAAWVQPELLPSDFSRLQG